ncbi:MAG: hypothetical protein U0R64_04320 [Candidatus Nanopelagicales bacterium]
MPRRALRRRRIKWIAIAGGLATVAVVGASAATLGTLTPQTLGASTAVVAACQSSGLGVSWGGIGYATTPIHTVSSGTVTGIAAGCITNPGKSYRVDVSTGAAASLANATGTFPTTGAPPQTSAFTLSTAVSAASITQVTLVVYG